jgi:hypothetical protein
LARQSEEFDAFLDGYGLPADRYRQMEDDVHVLMPLHAIDKLRWAVDRHPVSNPIDG